MKKTNRKSTKKIVETIVMVIMFVAVVAAFIYVKRGKIYIGGIILDDIVMSTWIFVSWILYAIFVFGGNKRKQERTKDEDKAELQVILFNSHPLWRKKVDGSYSDDEGYYLGKTLWRSILVQLKKKFEENNLLSVVKFPLIYQFMSPSEMRETVIRFLPEYAKCIGRPCYFFIDGLDHAARSKDVRNSFLSQLPRPEEIGDDFYFVLVGQPINEGYPSWMKDNKSITYFNMPALDTDDVVILLKQSGVVESTVDLENLAKSVISIIGNNVLNIMFAILELKKMVLPLSFDAIERELNSRFLNKQIDKYYDWIIGSQEKSLLFYKIEAIMAFASNRINACDIAEMAGCEHDEAVFTLNGLYPIIVCEDDEYFAFHNDVRLYLQNEIVVKMRL